MDERGKPLESGCCNDLKCSCQPDERRITIGQEEECLCQQAERQRIEEAISEFEGKMAAEEEDQAKAGPLEDGSLLLRMLEAGKLKIMEIFSDIYTERSRQDSVWGHAFDDKNTINDWVTYICQYATVAAGLKLTDDDRRLALRKVAAIAVAALEASYRNDGFPPRHYENEACNDPNACWHYQVEDPEETTG